METEGVNDGVDVFAVKRGRTSDSVESNNATQTKRRSISEAGPSFGNISDIVNLENVSTTARAGSTIKVKKLRAPPRKLPVTKKIISIWDKMDEVNAPISLKDWIANDKAAQKDLKDGLRYLSGRSKPSGKGKAPINTAPMVMTAQQAPHNDSVSSGILEDKSSMSDSDSDESTTSTSSVNSDCSDDTVYDYPYTRSNLDRSSPLSVLGTINNHAVKMVIDSGSSISVISKGLATQLGLIGIGDRIHIRTIETNKDRRKRNECEVTVSVPVRVGGKLRPKHMVIRDDSITTAGEPLVLLGMTWLEQYDISVHAKEKLIEIPVKNGGNSIMIQGQRQIPTSNMENVEIFFVSLHAEKNNPILSFCVEQLLDEDEDNDDDIMSTGCQVFSTDVVSTLSNDKTSSIIGDGVTIMEDNMHSDIPKEIISYLDEAVPEEDNEFRYNLDPDSGVTVNPEVDLEESFAQAVAELPEEIGALVKENKNQFAEFGGLGCIKGAEFNITLKPDATPVRSKAYRLTWEEDQYLKKELASMLKLGIIRPSSSSFTSPIFFIQRRTGGLRLIFDMRQLN